MIEWVRELGNEWGAYIRKPPAGYPARNILERIRTEGAGASIRTTSPFIPIRGMNARISKFHRAFRHCKLAHQWVLLAYHAGGRRFTPKQKARAVGMRKSKFFKTLHDAHQQIEGFYLADAQMRGNSR